MCLCVFQRVSKGYKCLGFEIADCACDSSAESREMSWIPVMMIDVVHTPWIEVHDERMIWNGSGIGNESFGMCGVGNLLFGYDQSLMILVMRVLLLMVMVVEFARIHPFDLWVMVSEKLMKRRIEIDVAFVLVPEISIGIDFDDLEVFDEGGEDRRSRLISL